MPTPTEGRNEEIESLSLPPITIFSSIDNIGLALRERQKQYQQEQQQQGNSNVKMGNGVVFPSNLIEITDTDALDGYGGTVIFEPSQMSNKTRQQLNDAEILITEPHVLAKLLNYIKEQEKQRDDVTMLNLSKLRWCQSTYAGVDPLFPKKNSNDHDQDDGGSLGSIGNSPQPSFILTRFAGAFGPPIAEWCIGRIIEHERSFQNSRIDQSNKRWAGSKQILEYRYLSDLTLGILGCGDIGSCIAKSAKLGFSMKVVGYKRSISKSTDEPDSKKPKLDGELFNYFTASLKDIFQQCDYIISVLPSTNETRGMLTPAMLSNGNKANGGKSPVFINVGRGDVISPATAPTQTLTTSESTTPPSNSLSSSSNTICNALNNNDLSHAILDVFEIEPLPTDDPLWIHPKVTVSPHVSGLTRSSDVPNLVLDNYQRYVSSNGDGGTLKYQVNWNKTY